MTEASELRRTPLHAEHVALGARLVPFAGYEMPVNYPGGIIAEHRWCRENAALFDVSHMGQLRLVGDQAAATHAERGGQGDEGGWDTRQEDSVRR